MLLRRSRRCLLVAICIMSIADGYMDGEVVSTLVRSQSSQLRTAWSDILRAEMPRFNERSSVTMTPPVPHNRFAAGSEASPRRRAACAEFTSSLRKLSPPSPPATTPLPLSLQLKMALSFSDSRFIVPWIPVVDGEGAVMTVLALTFLHEGRDITRVKWAAEYSDPPIPEASAGVAPSIELRYDWELMLETDIEAALIVLFGGAILLTAALICGICGAGDTVATPQHAKRRI